MIRVAIFASGSGSNFERLATCYKGHGTIQVVSLYCNKPDAFAIKRAEKLNIPTHIFDRNEWKGGEVLKSLLSEKIDFIVLAGFLWLVPEAIIQAFPSRIINVHPALLPNYGGKGMYGHFVHEAVIANGDKESGITIHLVNEEYDKGEHLLQAHTSINPGDGPHELAEKIHQLEHRYFPEVVENYILKVGGK